VRWQLMRRRSADHTYLGAAVTLARSFPHLWAVPLLPICFLLGCQATTDSAGLLYAFTLVAHVQDSTGAPVPGAALTAYAWPYPLPPYPPPSSIASGRTASDGRIVIPLGSFPTEVLDSLLIRVQSPGCRLGSYGAFHFPAADPALTKRDTLFVQLVVTAPPSPASTTAGKYCAFGIFPDQGPPAEYGFNLQVDSIIAGQVYGSWSINHIASYGSSHGPFFGVATSTFIVLDLANDYDVDPCQGRLVGTVEADGAWGPAYFDSPEKCVGAPTRFDFRANP